MQILAGNDQVHDLVTSPHLHGLPRPATAFHGIPRPSTAFHGLPWPSVALSDMHALASNEQPYGQRLEKRYGTASIPAAEMVIAGERQCMHRGSPLLGPCVPLELRTGCMLHRGSSP